MGVQYFFIQISRSEKESVCYFFQPIDCFQIFGGDKRPRVDCVVGMHHAHDCSVVNVVQYFYMRSSSLGIQGSH
jgi:hypothetical protein